MDSEKLVYGFEGIQRWLRASLFDKTTRLQQTLLADENYMDDLRTKEVDYKVDGGDWDQDWEDHCRAIVHDHQACPHGDDDQKARYERAFQKLFRDEGDKRSWANDSIEWEELAEYVSNIEGPEEITYFLKDHPIDEVAGQHHGWLDIDDVVGFCPGCDEPLTEGDVGRMNQMGQVPEEVGLGHFFKTKTCDCAGVSDWECLYDQNAEFRRIFRCPQCGNKDALDALEGPFEERWGKPFHWPPGAMYPPNRGFAGEHLALPELDKE